MTILEELKEKQQVFMACYQNETQFWSPCILNYFLAWDFEDKTYRNPVFEGEKEVLWFVQNSLTKLSKISCKVFRSFFKRLNKRLCNYKIIPLFPILLRFVSSK